MIIIRGLFLLSLLVLSSFFSSASAEIYSWQDSSVHALYSDSPPSGVRSEKQAVSEQRIGRASIMQAAAQSRGNAAVNARPYKDIRVVMYMTSWCPYCRKARDYIHSLGVSLTEYDIEQDRSKHEEMLRKSGGASGVPFIDVEGIIVRGYSPEAIRAAVEERRRL